MEPKKKRLFGRNLSDTAFSKERLIIYTLAALSIMTAYFIYDLTKRQLEVPPSLGMAFGASIMALVDRFEKENRS